MIPSPCSTHEKYDPFCVTCEEYACFLSDEEEKEVDLSSCSVTPQKIKADIKNVLRRLLIQKINLNRECIEIGENVVCKGCGEICKKYELVRVFVDITRCMNCVIITCTKRASDRKSIYLGELATQKMAAKKAIRINRNKISSINSRIEILEKEREK